MLQTNERYKMPPLFFVVVSSLGLYIYIFFDFFLSMSGVESVVVDEDNPVVVVKGRFLLEKLRSRLLNVANKVVTVKRSEMEETQEQGESSHGDDHVSEQEEDKKK